MFNKVTDPYATELYVFDMASEAISLTTGTQYAFVLRHDIVNDGSACATGYGQGATYLIRGENVDNYAGGGTVQSYDGINWNISTTDRGEFKVTVLP